MQFLLWIGQLKAGSKGWVILHPSPVDDIPRLFELFIACSKLVNSHHSAFILTHHSIAIAGPAGSAQGVQYRSRYHASSEG